MLESAQSPEKPEDEGTDHSPTLGRCPHQRAELGDEGDHGGDRQVQLPRPVLGGGQRGSPDRCSRDRQEDLHAGFADSKNSTHKSWSQVASPLERFGSFARVRPFFASRNMDHANNILSALQNGGDFSNLGSLWRSKRDTFDFESINRLGNGNGILNPDEDDILEFLGQFADFKGNVASRMGNLTCVLKEMKMMTPDNKVNLEAYTTGITGESSFSFGMDYNIEGSAVSDPKWRRKFSDGSRDCYKLAQNWPQSSLNRNPITRLFGRHMIFFRCADVSDSILQSVL